MLVRFLITILLFFALTDVYQTSTAYAFTFINFYTDSFEDTFSYPKEGIVVIPNGKIKISVVEEYSYNGKINLIELRAKYGLSLDGYENLSFTIFIFELDMDNYKYTILGYGDFDSNGNILFSYVYKDKKWYFAEKDSPARNLIDSIKNFYKST
ncbi:hypothetical protein Thena_0871 [Thermodesulfobium narugense DSM 14796]|uniref:Uncharacterized protein n=2 Tax=Thermodesulfobium narugense TaxID=184064 RepID=M1E5U9_9BACT|nr:hypothetical protein Thena_0871 [Thermodesulfobium narugense DSM 14796]